MNATLKSPLAKTWKNESAELAVGRHDFDDVLLVRLKGSVDKHEDQLVSPTVSIPLVNTLALFWDKAGLNRDQALMLLREAITEAMDDKVNENAAIQQRIDDVQEAITAVRKELIDQLPKMKRSGRIVTKEPEVNRTSVGIADELAA